MLEQGEKLILQTPDPAVARAVGYRRFLVGLDLGQALDPSAWVIMRDERLPHYENAMKQALHERSRVAVQAGRIKDTSYVEIARFVGRLLADPAIAGRCHLVVDATGVGRAFCDVLDEMSIPHVGVQMTAGTGSERPRGSRYWSVGKNRLLSDLNGGLHTHKLRLGDFPLRTDLVREIESFQVTWSAASNMRLEGGDDQGHADMAIALALAWWASDCPAVGARFGQGKLTGWI